jgi:chaperonin GroES
MALIRKEIHMNLKPLNNKIILEAVSAEEKTKSGIIIPDTANKEKPEQGKVLAVGSGKLLENGERAKMDVKVGDTVIFSKYSPNEIKVDGKEYLVISDEDVLAIVG